METRQLKLQAQAGAASNPKRLASQPHAQACLELLTPFRQIISFMQDCYRVLLDASGRGRALCRPHAKGAQENHLAYHAAHLKGLPALLKAALEISGSNVRFSE